MPLLQRVNLGWATGIASRKSVGVVPQFPGKSYPRQFSTCLPPYLPRRSSALHLRNTGPPPTYGELFADFASDLLTMMRLAGNFEADAKLDQIYENMRAEYKYSIRLEDLTD